MKKPSDEASFTAPRSNQICAAYGCTLAGSITDTTCPTPTTSWFCRFHFGVPADQWAAITTAIRQHDGDIAKAHTLTVKPAPIFDEEFA